MKLLVAGPRDMRLSVPTLVDTLEILKIKVDEIVSAAHLYGPSWTAEEYSIDNLDKNATMFGGEWQLGLEALEIIALDLADHSDAALIFSIEGEEDSEMELIKKEFKGQKKPIYNVEFKKP